METLSDRIRLLIDEKGVTPYEISRMTGVSQSTLSRILSGTTTKLSIDNITLLAGYFNVSYDWLSTGKGDRTPDPYPRNVFAGRKASDVGSAYFAAAPDYVSNLIGANNKLAHAVDVMADSNKILAQTNQEQTSNNTKLIENQSKLISELMRMVEGRGGDK